MFKFEIKLECEKDIEGIISVKTNIEGDCKPEDLMRVYILLGTTINNITQEQTKNK